MGTHRFHYPTPPAEDLGDPYHLQAQDIVASLTMLVNLLQLLGEIPIH